MVLIAARKNAGGLFWVWFLFKKEIMYTKPLWRSRVRSPTLNHYRTLKSELESTAIPNVFFPVRSDFDALHSLYQIALANVDDLELLELARGEDSNGRKLWGKMSRRGVYHLDRVLYHLRVVP